MAFFEGNKMTGGYGKGPDIINSCSVKVDRGEIVSILGPNGAGKSTAMKAMLGLLNLKAGTVIINGKDISSLSPQDRVKEGISFVPQTKNVFSGMSVEENLEMGAFLINEDYKKVINEIYDLFPILFEKKNQLVGQINLTNLDSKEPEPTVQSLEWDATVDTYAELTYINTADLSGTVRYLVKADETSNNFWAIYTWDGTIWSRTKLQTYNTSTYWNYTDWYGTDPSIHEMIHTENTPIDKQVTFEYELDGLDLSPGQHAKVTNADTGGWKMFMKTTTGWTNIGTENGTIRL